MKTQDPTHPIRQRSLRRETEALRLRALRFSYQEIADKIGVPKARAYSQVQSALAKETKQRDKQVEITRKLELVSLDQMQSALSEGISRGSTDHVNASLRVMERRARMMGLDAPTKLDGMHGHFSTDVKFMPRDVMQKAVMDAVAEFRRAHQKSPPKPAPVTPPSVHDQMTEIHDQTIGKMLASNQYFRHRSIQAAKQ